MKRILAALAALVFAAPSLALAAASPVLRGMEVVQFAYGALRAPQYINARVLAANTAESISIPTNAVFVVFSATCNFYVSYDADTAVVPGSDVDDGTSNELNPTVRYVSGLTTLSVISPTTCVITAAFYRS